MSEDYVCLVDGVAIDTIPVSDSAVIRGDGVFEAIRSYDGHLFRASDHLDRMEQGASRLGLTLPDRDAITDWMARASQGLRDCVVRVIITRGSAIPGVEGEPRCVVIAHPVPDSPLAFRLYPMPAPWHAAGRPWLLAGVKATSYAPNMASTRQARMEGYDDALLLADDGTVLEMPTASIGWVRNGQVFTPALDLGILESITRRVTIEVSDGVKEVHESLAAVQEADEVFVMSTVKEISPVVAVGEATFEPGPVTAELAQRFGAAVAGVRTSH